MHRIVVCSARLVAVHNSHVARELSDRYTDVAIRSIRMGVAGPPESTRIERQQTIRERHGIPEDALLFCTFGLITPEKRIARAIEAVAWLRAEFPQVYLMLVGDSVPHYDARADALRAGLLDRIRLTGYVPEEELHAYIETADVGLCLRWPSSGETSASWLRCLAAGKATVTTDLEHTADEPVMDPRSWATLGNQPAITLRLDLLDEDHSLRLAIRRLARDVGFRERLGASGRAWWAGQHTLQHMHEDYEHVIEEAINLPDPAYTLPPHLRHDGLENLRALLKPFGRDATGFEGSKVL
ncbi:MAG: glycosyltransferase family 4 protein [Acidimicrobiia bacterium]